MKIMDRLISLTSVSLTVVSLIGYGFGMLPAMQQRSLFLGMILSIILLKRIQEKLEEQVMDILSIFMLLAAAAACAYVFVNWKEMPLRLTAPGRLDTAMGIALIAAVVYCADLKLGKALPVLAMLFILYALLGGQIGGSLGNSGFSIQRVVSILTMDTSGIFGTILGTASKQIFVFVVFGSFLELSGASRFFLDYIGSLLAGLRGSGAKANTLASVVFGMVSGSAVANVMAVGPMTFPMMKRDGFDDSFSGSISAIAGTGGQLMPPVMGTAAFIIAETLSISYGEVTKAALIPGCLFYLAVWTAVNCRANRLGLKAGEKQGSSFPVLRQGFYYFIPIVFLIVTISVLKWSAVKAGLWSTLLVFLVSQLNPRGRMNGRAVYKALEHSAKGALVVSAACAAAGIIVGVLSLTGLGLKLSSVLLDVSGGHLMALLVFTMITGLILGMGMTTTSVYIVLSVLVAPALVEFGIPAMAAHLFVFYFGILSCITPPVATAVFASASLLEISPFKLGLHAVRTAIPVYMIPFLFVLNPQLLMLEGGVWEIALETVLSGMSIMALSAGVEGFFCTRLGKPKRFLLFAAAVCELSPLGTVKALSNLVIAVILGTDILAARRKNI